MISVRQQLDDQRGASVSVLVAACLPAFVLACGIAVDGSVRLSAQREVTVAAAQAAQAGSDAFAASRLFGHPAPAEAVAAAHEVLADHGGIAARVEVDASGRLRVHTSTSVDTRFLSLAGIQQFTVNGEATAELRQS